MGEKICIGFIGFGNMAQAIAKGVEQLGAGAGVRMVAYNPHPEKILAFGGGVEAAPTAAAAAQQAKYLFLCVKPQMLAASAPEFRAAIAKDAVVVSILAGVSRAKLQTVLATDRPIVRVMPNTPLLLGAGTTAVARPAGIADADYAFVLGIFRAIGTAYEIPEDKFDEIVPVNGSSPALLYRLARLVAANAEKHGLPFDQSLAMFADTLAGCAKMIKESGRDIVSLEQMVCSKGGTTLAMLDRLEEHGFSAAVDDGLDRCIERSKELGKG